MINMKHNEVGEIAIVYTLQYHRDLDHEEGRALVPAIAETTAPDALAEQVILYQPEVWKLWGRLHAMQLDNDKPKDTTARLAVELRIDPLEFDQKNHFRKDCAVNQALYTDPNDRTRDLFRTSACEASNTAGRNAASFSAGGYNLVLNRILRSDMTAACADRYEPWTRKPSDKYDFCKTYFDVFQYLQYSQGVGAWNIYTQSLLGAEKKRIVNVMAEETSLQEK